MIQGMVFSLKFFEDQNSSNGPYGMTIGLLEITRDY